MPWSTADLDSRWADVLPSPQNTGSVTQVCVRPDLNQRVFPDDLHLDPKRGAVGDRWERRTWIYLPDGRPDPRVQVAMMNSRMLTFLQTLTGCCHHPGDTLLVDLDLSARHLPVGTQVRAGSATLEISDVENDACAKFALHYGNDVLAWIRNPQNRERRLRGVFARVVSEGVVRNGDVITTGLL